MSRKAFWIGVVSAALYCILHAGAVQAYSISESDPIMQKIIYEAALQCYEGLGSNGYVLNTFTTLGDFKGTIESLQGNRPVNEGGSEGGDSRVIYYGLTPKDGGLKLNSKEGISCNDLLTNYTANRFSSGEDNDENSKAIILSGMAYTKISEEVSNNTDKCMSYTYYVTTENGNYVERTTEKLCAKKQNGHWNVSIDMGGGSGTGKEISFENETRDGIVRVSYIVPKSSWGGIVYYKLPFWNDAAKQFEISIPDDLVNETAVFSRIGNELAEKLGYYLIGEAKGSKYDSYGLRCNSFIEGSQNTTGITCDEGENSYVVPFSSASSEGGKYQVIDIRTNYDRNTLINTLSNSKWKYALATNSIQFSDMQKYNLYTSYLKDIYGVTNKTCYDDGGHNGFDYEVKLWWEEKSKYSEHCYIVVRDNKDRSVYGVGTDGYFGIGVDLNGLIAELNSLDLGDNPPTSIIEGGSNDGSGTYDEEASCYTSAVKSLGWVLCPVLEFLTDASGDLYDKYVEPALTLNSTLFDSNQQGGKATYDAWSGFRDIANVIFAVLFLVVIFSQLTGIGIDNYGIKKILPKMIIAAILINISYLVCTLLIDLSNIVGSGIQGIFSNMKVDGASSLSVGGTTQAIAATAISSVAVLTTLVTSVAAVWSNPSIILTLLVSALGTIIAIFFLFVILAAREAAVLVLTVISPIAVVLYMLPNTKKVFDKWIKAFQTLLLLFPICGLLVGGGNFVSKLLLASSASGGFFSALMAMIVGIAPIFFIPSLLSNSLKALGNIGAKISSVGGKLGKGVTNGIRGFEGFKNAQQFGAERRTRIKAGFDSQGNQKNLNAFQRAIRGGSRNVERYRGKYQKLVAERGSLEATEGQDFMLETDINNELKRINSSGEINSNVALQTGLANALANGDRAKIGAYTDALSNKGEDGRQAVKNAYESMSGRMSDLAARTFADNIMKKHGANYKNNNRSMFEVVKGISTSDPNVSGSARSAAVSVSDFAKRNRAFLAGKSTSVTLGNMDDDAFAEVFGGYNSGNPVSIPDGADAAALGAAAYDALHDQNANIKVERRKYLEELAKYAPAREQNVNIVGGSVDANVTNPVLNVRNADGNANANGTVDVNIKQNNDQNGPVDDAGQII